MMKLACLLLIAGCSSQPTTSTTSSSPPPAPAPTPTPTEPAPTEPTRGPSIGENCGEADACGVGLTCVSYLGIAGARGPTFKTCELRCDKGACPDGRNCVTIADGPGQVCR